MCKDPRRARLDAVFQGEAALACGVVARPRSGGKGDREKGTDSGYMLWGKQEGVTDVSVVRTKEKARVLSS